MRSIILLTFFSSIAFSQEIEFIKKILSERATGDSAVFAKAISPALSLQTNLSETERIATVNNQITNEIQVVTSAIVAAKADQVPAAAHAAAAKFDVGLADSSGHINFEGDDPSAAQTRNLFLIPKASIRSPHPAAEVINTLTSYKRSAKTNDFFFDYQEPLNLTVGQVTQRVGSETSWLKPEALKEFDIGKNYVLKKCRQLLGWRCITSLYRVDAVESRTGKSYILFIGLYDMDANPDNAFYANDKRTKNQITGSTAIYIVKETQNWIAIYGSDYQFNNAKNSFAGAIQKEYVNDQARLKQRLSADLGILSDLIK